MLRQTYVGRPHGSVRVPVCCVHCSCRFSYRMERTATHTITNYGSISRHSMDAADDMADDKLEDKLAEDFDCVPCPRCGEYQPEMAERLKTERYKGLLRFQVVLIVFTVLAGLATPLFGFVFYEAVTNNQN